MVYAGQTMGHRIAELAEAQRVRVRKENDFPTAEDFRSVGYVGKVTRRKKPNSYYFFRSKDDLKLCKVDGCDEVATCKGMCNHHYNKQYRRKKNPHKLKLRKAVTLCSICKEPAVSRGLCKHHYSKWQWQQEKNARPPVTDEMVKDVQNPFPHDEWLYPDQKNRYLFINQQREKGRKKN